MKKKHLLLKILSTLSLSFLLGGCTTLSYVNDDFEQVKSYNVQTPEMFSVKTFEKTFQNQTVSAGISETVLEQALVLYISIQNNSDEIYKFDLNDLKVTSPIGEVAFLLPSHYIEAYQSYEASTYAGLASAGAALGNFASISNQYRQTTQQSTRTAIENRNLSPEFAQLEESIAGIQKHSLTTYKFINPNESEYFYIFLKKPEEYPIEVDYKGLIYKFGGKKNENNK